MRMIGSLYDPQKAKAFSAYLRTLSIENTCEIAFNKEEDRVVCSLWAHDEDAIEKALAAFVAFQENPNDPKYDLPPETSALHVSAIENPHYQKKTAKREAIFGITTFFIALCIGIFLLDAFQQNLFSTDRNARYVVLSSVQEWLLYDLPEKFLLLDQLFSEYGITRATDWGKLSESARNGINAASKMPYFQGFYTYFIYFLEGQSIEIPSMWNKIREGQLWRFFTPALLHRDIFHILFNMIWLWILGKQIEERLPAIRFLLLILIAGAFSNSMQYLMSGPLFLGFSGVVLGMVAFIWMRQKVAPWEGYPLSKRTLVFITFFVLATTLFQLITFFLELSGQGANFQIANTAHLSGLLIGAILGRSSFFSWRVD